MVIMVGGGETHKKAAAGGGTWNCSLESTILQTTVNHKENNAWTKKKNPISFSIFWQGLRSQRLTRSTDQTQEPRSWDPALYLPPGWQQTLKCNCPAAPCHLAPRARSPPPGRPSGPSARLPGLALGLWNICPDAQSPAWFPDLTAARDPEVSRGRGSAPGPLSGGHTSAPRAAENQLLQLVRSLPQGGK